jgi:hypothetical protein
VTDQLHLFEEDLSDAERDAVAADFLARYSDAPTRLARPCVCANPILFAGLLGEGRCSLCGREPRDRGRNDAALGVEGTDP